MGGAMQVLFGLGLLLSVLALFVGLVILIFSRSRRSFARRLMGGAVALAIVCVVGSIVTEDPNSPAVLARKAERAREAQEAKVLDEARKAAAAAEAQVAKVEADRAAAAEAARSAFFAAPDTQAAFIQAVEEGAAAYAAAPNDLAKGGARRDRAKALCAAVSGGKVENWSGTIVKLDTNGDGMGVVTIRLTPQLHVKTWNNALSDIGSDTLMDPDSAVFRKFAALAEGASVLFSGRLLRDQQAPDCFREASISMAGAMRDPEIIIRFSDVRTYED